MPQGAAFNQNPQSESEKKQNAGKNQNPIQFQSRVTFACRHQRQPTDQKDRGAVQQFLPQ